MYLLTIKDGLVTRHVGPYPSTKQASDDLDRVLSIVLSGRAGKYIPLSAHVRWLRLRPNPLVGLDNR